MYGIIKLLLKGFFITSYEQSGNRIFSLRHKTRPNATLVDVVTTTWGWAINGLVRQDIILDLDEFLRAKDWKKNANGRWVEP